MLRCDLHVHTHFSDGTKSPEEVIEIAHKKGIKIIGITDHDDLRGIEPAIRAASKNGIEVIPGIELSAIYDGIDVHVLGYFIDYRSEKLVNFLRFVREVRENRALEILKKLRALNIDVPEHLLKKYAGHGAIGRPHIARAMVELGYVNDIGEAFDKYIGYDKPAYVPKYKISVKEAIDLIHENNGISILAHPGLIKDKREEIIEKSIEWGIDGLEVWHPENGEDMRDFLLKLARERNLTVTGGSDYHGENKKDFELGNPVLYCELEDKKIRMRSNDQTG